MRHRSIGKITTGKTLYAEIALLQFSTLFYHFSKFVKSKQHNISLQENIFMQIYEIYLKYTICVHCLMGFPLNEFDKNAMILIVYHKF